MRRGWHFVCAALAGSFVDSFFFDVTPVLADADVQVRAAESARYFLEDKKIRHVITELGIRHSMEATDGVSTVLDARLIYDAALFSGPFGTVRDYGPEVRGDEGFAAEIRNAYLDILTETVAIKAGRFAFDWMESLSPRTSDAVTPLDLRFGGFDSGSSLIEPVDAVSANTSFGFASVEVMFLPFGRHHRLAKAANGYGYVERVTNMLGGLREILSSSGVSGEIYPSFKRGDVPDDIKTSELGIRALTSVDGVDISAFAWRGHQRSPNLTFSLGQSALSTNQVLAYDLSAAETFPELNSYGVFGSWAGDASVVRLFGLSEPNRVPAVTVDDELSGVMVISGAGTAYDPAMVLGDRAYRVGAKEARQRWGLGFDYVFSKHLKLYSEAFQTHSYISGQKVAGAEVRDQFKDHAVTVRLTNETLSDVFISCDATLTGPARSWLVHPEIAIDWRDDESSGGVWKLAVGGWLVQSESNKSSFAMLRDARQVYVKLSAWR